MFNLTNPIFIILLSTGLCIWLIGLYVLHKPPKFINRSRGYRTPNAMKSKEAWDYAQIYGTKKIIKGAQIMCLMSIPALLSQTTELIGTFVAIAIVLLCLLMPIVLTEKELKEKF